MTAKRSVPSSKCSLHRNVRNIFHPLYFHPRTCNCAASWLVCFALVTQLIAALWSLTFIFWSFCRYTIHTRHLEFHDFRLFPQSSFARSERHWCHFRTTRFFPLLQRQPSTMDTRAPAQNASLWDKYCSRLPSATRRDVSSDPRARCAFAYPNRVVLLQAVNLSGSPICSHVPRNNVTLLSIAGPI